MSLFNIFRPFLLFLPTRLFFFMSGSTLKDCVYLILYFDNLLIVSGNIQRLEMIKRSLSNAFDMVDLKEIKLFLGIRITRSDNQMTLDQSSYIKTALAKFSMTNCNNISTPLEIKLDHVAMDTDDESCSAPIKSAIGCLMYLMICTRPDISNAVNILSKYASKCNNELWKNIKRNDLALELP